MISPVKEFRYDIGGLSSPVLQPNGWLRADGHLTKAGVFSYINPDGSERRELRPDEEVFHDDSLSSFSLVPVTDDHPEAVLTSTNTSRFQKGTVGEVVRRDGQSVRALLLITDKATIEKMQDGKCGLSCGYEVELEKKSGTHPVYGRYDAVQRNIRGNHVAIVRAGRAGPDARVRMDASEEVLVAVQVEREDATKHVPAGSSKGGQFMAGAGGGGGGGGGGGDARVPGIDGSVKKPWPGFGESKDTGGARVPGIDGSVKKPWPGFGEEKGGAGGHDSKLAEQRAAVAKAGAENPHIAALKARETTRKAEHAAIKKLQAEIDKHKAAASDPKLPAHERQAAAEKAKKLIEEAHAAMGVKSEPAKKSAMDDFYSGKEFKKHDDSASSVDQSSDIPQTDTKIEVKHMNEELKAALADSAAQKARADVYEAELELAKARLDQAEGITDSLKVQVADSLERAKREDEPVRIELENQVTALTGQVNSLKAELRVANDPTRRREDVRSRVRLEAAAASIFGNKFKTDSMTDGEIVRGVLEKLHGPVPTDRSEEYLRARFDAAVEGYFASEAALARARDAVRIDNKRQDDAMSARDRMVAFNRNREVK